MPKEPGLYHDVEVYDILHAPGTPAEVSGLQRIARRFVGLPASTAGAVWLEPACGTGRYLVVAARRGVRGIGFDSSPGMVAYARRQLANQSKVRPGTPRGRIFCADMARFAEHIGKDNRSRPDFAFNLINTIRHLESDAAMLQHLDDVSKVLKRNGVYAVGLSITAYGVEFPSEDVWEGSRGGTRIKQVVQYIPPEAGDGKNAGRFEKVYSHLVITRGTHEEHRDSAYHLRCYSKAQWLRLIDRSAMEIVGIVDEDGHDTRPPELGYAIWILKPRITQSVQSD